MITTVTGKNQVTVPAEIAAREKLKPGSRLEWQLTGEEHTILVRILPDRGAMASELQGAGRKHKRRGTSAVRNLLQERALEQQERLPQ